MSQIYEITPFTQLDYPGELACIVWFSGCNLRCVYCHNPDIVLHHGKKDDVELLAFLESRRGRLTGVVFSGGEATFCPTLPALAQCAKEMGFKTKLDTNGSNPDVLRDLIGSRRIDSFALDYKCPPSLSDRLLGTRRFNDVFCESLDLLIAAHNAQNIALEIRTTVPPDYLTETDIGWMIEDLGKRGYRGTYWLQNLVSSGEKTLGNIAASSRPFDQTLLPTPKGFTLGFRNFPKSA